MKGHGSASEPRGTRTSISQGAPLARARSSAGRSSSGEEARAPETPKAHERTKAESLRDQLARLSEKLAALK